MQFLWYLIIPKLKSLVVKDMVAHNMESTVEDNAVNRSDYSRDYMACFMNGNEGCEVLLYDE